MAPAFCAEEARGAVASTGMRRTCDQVPARTRRPLSMLPRLPPFSATRSTVLGVDRENFSQPPSSGPAVPLVLNHTACTVTHTCEYCAGVLPVSDTSDLVPQPTSSPPTPKVAAMSATCRRWFMPVPVPVDPQDDATNIARAATR